MDLDLSDLSIRLVTTLYLVHLFLDRSNLVDHARIVGVGFRGIWI